MRGKFDQFISFIVVCLGLVFYSGCSRHPDLTTSPITSPLVTSPVSTPKVVVPNIPKFRLNRPLVVGTEEVTGSGPAGVPIVVMDVSYNTVIGRGTVDSGGQFSIKVAPPLKAYSLIGVMLDETRESPYPKEQLPCGENCRDQPLVGLLYDYAPVIHPAD